MLLYVCGSEKESRAAELRTQLPDPLLMIRTLDGISKPIVNGSSQASFRIATQDEPQPGRETFHGESLAFL